MKKSVCMSKLRELVQMLQIYFKFCIKNNYVPTKKQLKIKNRKHIRKMILGINGYKCIKMRQPHCFSHNNNNIGRIYCVLNFRKQIYLIQL